MRGFADVSVHTSLHYYTRYHSSRKIVQILRATLWIFFKIVMYRKSKIRLDQHVCLISNPVLLIHDDLQIKLYKKKYISVIIILSYASPEIQAGES